MSITKICNIGGCEKLVASRGWCSMHKVRWQRHGDPLITLNPWHGLTNTPEYDAWSHMVQRCHNPKDVGYKYYGERGVKVCRQWRKNFIIFYQDMGVRPSTKHSLERMDNSGNYEPANCRWATKIEQANNTRRNRWITIRGRKQTISQWAKEIGITPGTLRGRIERGWSEDRLLLPSRKLT